MPENEVITQLQSIRADIGKENKALGERVDAALKSVEKGEGERTALRKELDELKERTGQVVKDHEEAKKRARLESFRREGVKDAKHGFFLIGAGIRAKFVEGGASYLKIPQYETDALKEFREHRATLLESGAVTGSYVVPTGFVVDLIDTMEQAQDIVSFADVVANLPGNVDMPTIVSRPTFAHKRASKGDALAKAAAAFGSISIRPEEGSICFDIDNQLIRMSPVDLGALFVRLMNESLTGALSYDIVMGDGSADFNEITGFLKVADAEDVFALAAGKTAFADVGYQDFYSITAKPLARCAANGRWFMSRDVIGIVSAIDCNGKVPLITYNNGSRELLARPITLGEDFPLVAASGAGKPFMAFGDLQSYMVGILGAPDVAFSEHVRFDKGQTQARLLTYFDIVRKFKRGMCTVKTGAAQ